MFIDLLDSDDLSYDVVNKLSCEINATTENPTDMRLNIYEDGFELGIRDNERKQAYIQECVNGDEHLTNLDKLQFFCHRYERGQAIQNHVEKWGVDDNLWELAGATRGRD